MKHEGIGERLKAFIWQNACVCRILKRHAA